MQMNYFEKKNRKSQSLPILRIEIETAGGAVAVVEPNAAMMMAIEAEYPVGEPIAGRQSDCSKRPATHLFRADDVELALSLEELDRFMRFDLRPKEFEALRDKFGIFFQIHDDFYCFGTGRSVQPKPRSSDFAQVMERSRALEEKTQLGQVAAAGRLGLGAPRV
jgi:hypothetical protein